MATDAGRQRDRNRGGFLTVPLTTLAARNRVRDSAVYEGPPAASSAAARANTRDYVNVPARGPGAAPQRTPTTREAAGAQQPTGAQASLTDAEFMRRCEGFQEVGASDLLHVRGGRVRYLYEHLDEEGGVQARTYRLGGTLTQVDPELRFLRLLNPYARTTWTVQLRPRRARRTRLWYLAPPTDAEAVMMRKLLQQLENGEIVVERAAAAAAR